MEYTDNIVASPGTDGLKFCTHFFLMTFWEPNDYRRVNTCVHPSLYFGETRRTVTEIYIWQHPVCYGRTRTTPKNNVAHFYDGLAHKLNR